MREGLRHYPHFLQFAHIAKVDQDRGVQPLQLGRLVNADLVDQQPRGGDHFGYGLGDGHAGSRWLCDTLSG